MEYRWRQKSPSWPSASRPSDVSGGILAGVRSSSPRLGRFLPAWTSLALGLLLPWGSPAQAQGTTGHPAYYGGPVVSNPQVVVVNWGSLVDANVVNGMAGFYSSILESPYLDWVSEYSTVGLTGLTDGLAGSNQHIGRGSFGGSFTLAAPAQTTVSNMDVLMLLQAEIAVGSLPAPTKDAQGNPNTLYLVNFPPGVTVLSYGGTMSCAAPPMGFCGATDTMPVGSLNVGVGLVPDMSPGSPCTSLCGSADAGYFNNTTEVHAHLLLNLVTNVEYGAWNAVGTGTVARPIAWYNLGAEHQVADICTGVSADVGGYTVETGWSNTQSACVSAPATALGVCTAGQTYCRQCNSTDDGQDGGCTGATAACETDNTNVAFGECVQCTSATTCGGTTPVCAKGGTANDTCRGCEGDGECTTNSAGATCLTSGACGPAPAKASSSGCSATGGASSTVAVCLALLAFLLRRVSLLSQRQERRLESRGLRQGRRATRRGVSRWE
jgi:uncharacterized protein (TIGR03382 family)